MLAIRSCKFACGSAVWESPESNAVESSASGYARGWRDACVGDRCHDRAPDPWRFATSEYERGKYAATLAAISGRKIRSAFEVGCSIGILTRQLAAFCESLLAIDVAQQALEQARLNCAGQSNIEFARMQIPQEWPGETFDLLVLSEILYYFCADDIRQIAHKAISSLTSGGAALLVHWTGETDYPCQGDQAVECFLDASKGLLTPLLVRREAKYRLDLLVKQD